MLTNNIDPLFFNNGANLTAANQPFRHYLFFAFLCVFFISSSNAQTSENYELQQIANIKHQNISNTHWINILPNPRNSSLYYLANKTGQLYLIDDGEIKTPAILDFSHYTKIYLPESAELSAIILHPNFSFSDQAGFATFYTAHVEKRNKVKQTKRLSVNQNDVSYLFDAVITQWKFNQANFKKIDFDSPREIIRIALTNNKNGITQLSFNPYIKSWQEDFGLLYFSLAEDEQLSQYPLYSGAILRIKPNKFGQKEYTSPKDNPFTADKNIANELFIIGAQKIKRFIWPEKNNDKLLISHQFNNQNFLTLSDHEYDWRKATPEQLITHSEQPLSLLAYQGRKIMALRNKILFVNTNNQHWQLNTITFNEQDYAKKDIDNKTKNIAFTSIWPFDSELIAPKDNIQLYMDNARELLLLDKSNQFIYGLSQQQTAFNNANETVTPAQEQTSSPNNLSLFFIPLFITIYLIFLVRHYLRKKKSLSHLIKQSYSRLEIIQAKTKVALFKHRKKTPEIKLNVTDIIASEIMVNDETINKINLEEEGSPSKNSHCFNNESETEIRSYFSDIHQAKMVDGKVRKISLNLHDNHKKSYLITLYLRRGNHRFTKSKYHQVIEDLIDWSWFISQKLLPTETEKRIIKTTAESENPVVTATALSRKFKQQKQTKDQTPAKTEPKNSSAKKINIPPLALEKPQSSQSHLIDTELVNSLEKLVTLKKQGFLTESEFASAKHKLLKDLMSEKE